MTVALADVLELHPSVSLRPERFGALAYSFDTRKLSFLKHPDLVRVVEALDGTRTVEEALVAADVDPARRASFVRAIDTLVTSRMVRPVGAPDAA
ncbi:mycofactocin biosynthesis chaperone MftB [Dermatobacter hominis]|uniref:mycofactocin biosynthesis chaperone MftB n=1 Tax=Dermatobacter hominis TaxID=2884263 RepID=UPI001D108E69|nr:mycofactocin biosynthesis chaperone MftB [Dermatobacter hominis]UDY37777.1 mycofactocin biosynthesis chaperone MftB [Dermatobacter hominis]